MELEERQLEERYDRRNSWLLLLLALLLSCSCVFLSTNLALFFLGRSRMVDANLLAMDEADYGPDNYQTRLPELNPSVVAIALTDEAVLQITPTDDGAGSAGTPIALVTATSLPPPLPTGVPPTATAVPSTSTPTASVTFIPSPTPSSTVTALPTATSTSAPSSTPTQATFFTPIASTTPTGPPPVSTNTPTPNPPNPSRTPTPVSASPTPTFTSIPPTLTPTITSVPPTLTPTFTSIPPSLTPTFTSMPPTLTPTFTSVPPSLTPTFTSVPATLTPTPTVPTATLPPTNTPTNTPTASPTPTPTPTPSREALVVVANPGGLNSTDAAVQNRLIALSFTVILADDDTVVVADTLNRELVYISDSVNEGALGATLCDARAPVIVAKAALYDEMNMTSGGNGYEANQTDIDIIDPSHPMAAGLSGTVSLLTGSNNMGWGVTQPGAQQVASIAGDPSRITIFAYPASANVTCAALPVRRVGFPLASGAALTLDGWRLFDAAVNWIVP